MKDGKVKAERDKVKIPAEYVMNQSMDHLFEQAENMITRLYEGEDFLLSELWPGVFWKRIPRTTRLMFGMYFKQNFHKLNVVADGRLISNQMVYYKKTKA
jgi:hypothetical protein